MMDEKRNMDTSMETESDAHYAGNNNIFENKTINQNSGPVADFKSSAPQTTLAALSSLNQTVSTTSTYDTRPACFSTLFSEVLFILTATFSVAQTSIMNGALMVMSSRIQLSLSMTSSEVTWVVAGQSLTGGAFLLFFGRVADLFGRRMLLIWSMATFTVFVLIAGFARNAVMAITFLALAGVSCAAVVPPAIGKLGAIYEKPSRRKNRAFACFSAGNPVGFVLGALIGGITTDIASWRVTMWVIAVIYGAFTVVAWFTTPKDVEQDLRDDNGRQLTFWTKTRQMDWLGAALCVLGIGMFTASLTMASDAENGWATSYVIAMLVVGVVVVLAFLWWQTFFRFPLMPLRVWRDKNFSLLVASLCLGFYGFSENFFWLTLGWQRAYDDSPLIVAVKMLPAAIGGMIVNLVAALLMHKVSNKKLSILAAASTVGASVLLSASSKDISYWALAFPSQLLAVIGADIAFCVTNMYVMSSLPSEQQSVAGGMFQTATRLAATVGLGVSTTVFNAAGGTTEVSSSVDWRPYQATFWVSLVGAVAGLALTPFLTIGKQGARIKKKSDTQQEHGEDSEATKEVEVV